MHVVARSGTIYLFCDSTVFCKMWFLFPLRVLPLGLVVSNTVFYFIRIIVIFFRPSLSSSVHGMLSYWVLQSLCCVCTYLKFLSLSPSFHPVFSVIGGPILVCVLILRSLGFCVHLLLPYKNGIMYRNYSVSNFSPLRSVLVKSTKHYAHKFNIAAMCA